MSFHVTVDREFDFLCALADNPGQAVTKKDITTRVAGYPNSMAVVNLPEIRKLLRNRFIKAGFPESQFNRLLPWEGQLGYVLKADVKYL